METEQEKINQAGFSTLEILVAMFILVLAFSAAILVSFSNQTMIAASQTNAEALNIAQELVEKAQADSRQDFNLVNPQNATTTIDGFTEKLDVTQTDYFIKLVTARVGFPEDSGRYSTTTLTTVVTNFNNAVGGDTCSSILLPNAEAWKDPQLIKSVSNSDFADLTGFSSDNFSISDIDAYKGKLYVTINNSSATTSTVPTFFVFDINAPDAIAKIPGDFVDNDSNKKSGLNAVAVAENPADGKKYAYVANHSVAKQLQVIDVSSNPPVVKVSLAVSGQAVGNSIAYKNGYVYLGLKSSTSGPEFNIIDVHNPLLPSEVGHWPASGSLNHDINAIYIKNQYAFVATTASKKLIVLDISNASGPEEVGSFSDGGGNHGKSIFLVGDTLFLGRTLGGTELSILDEGNPATTTPPVLGGEATINASVDGIIVRGKIEPQYIWSSPVLAFLLTPSDFKILDVSDVTNIAPWGTKPLETGTFGSSIFEPVLDCEGNNFFVGSNDSSNNGYLSLIAP